MELPSSRMIGLCCLPSRVEGPVHLLDEGAVDVGVDLGGDDGAVAEHLLYGPEVGAPLEQVGGEGVAEGVGADRLFDAGQNGVLSDDVPRCHARQAGASRAEEQGVLGGRTRQVRPQFLLVSQNP